MVKRKAEDDLRRYIEKQVKELGIDIDNVPFEQFGAELISGLGSNITKQIRDMRIEMLRDPEIREFADKGGRIFFNSSENIVQFILRLNLDYKGSPFSRHHRLFVDILALVYLYISGQEEGVSDILRREAVDL